MFEAAAVLLNYHCPALSLHSPVSAVVSLAAWHVSTEIAAGSASAGTREL